MVTPKATTGLVVLLVALGIGFAPLDAPALAAGASYESALTPLLDGPGGKSIGAVEPGAAVTVLDQSGDASHVSVQGFAAQGDISVWADRIRGDEGAADHPIEWR